jgi:polar amino acid transport system substrate-binding protein
MKTFVKSVLSAMSAVALTTASNAQSPSPITVMGIDALPQGRASDGRGIMTDVVMEALKRAGLSGKLEFPPWKRAQEQVIAGKDILITALSRTPEREEKYTWIFPVFKYDRSFTTLGKIYNSFAEARESIKRVAVTIGSAQHDILLREGFLPSQIYAISIERQNIIPTMLLKDRVDAWFAVTVEAKYAIKGEAEASRFVVGPPIGTSTEQFVACSKDCNAELVAKLRKAGEEMTADGTIAEIVKRYQ